MSCFCLVVSGGFLCFSYPKRPQNTPAEDPKSDPFGRFCGTKMGPHCGTKMGSHCGPAIYFQLKRGVWGPKWDRIAGPKWDRFSSSFSSIWGVYFGPFFVFIFFISGCPFWSHFSSPVPSFWVPILVLCFVLIFLILRVRPCSWSLRREARLL